MNGVGTPSKGSSSAPMAPPEIPAGVPVLHTEAINGSETVAFVKHQAPDLVLVNGTQLLREPLLALRPTIRHGIVNLHTGLSPIPGEPTATFT